MDKISIGIRENGINGKVKAVFDFVISFILIVFTFMFFVIIFQSSNGLITFSLVIGCVAFSIFATIFIIYGIESLKIVNNNDLIIDKPCLTYSKDKEEFFMTNLLSNKELIIKKDKIEKIYGSLKTTNKLLYVFYIDDNDKIKKVPVGYCQNIEHESFVESLSGIIEEFKYR